LRWNEKHNGDNFLNRIAELFKKNVPTAKVIKLYDIDKSTIKIQWIGKESMRIAEVIKGYRLTLSLPHKRMRLLHLMAGGRSPKLKVRIPTVTISSNQFLALAKAQLRAQGLPEWPLSR